MTVFNDIEILVLYSSHQGREIPFLDIVQQKDVMDSEHYQPSTFWSAIGGLQIVVNNYNTIFYSTNFHHLVKVTSFLIHSMYWINGQKSDWFDTDDNYPNDVIIKTMSNQLLRLRKYNETEIALSFTPDFIPNQLQKRGERYFENIIVRQSDWYNAADMALNEYFEVLYKVIQANPNDGTSKIMKDYSMIWNDIKNVKTAQ